MIGADNVNTAIGHGTQQFLAVGISLYRRITLCQATGFSHRLLCETKVVWACFSRNMFARQSTRRQQRQFVGCSDMHQMKSGTRLARQVDGTCRSLQASLCRAQFVVQAYGNAVGIGLHKACTVSGNNIFTLGMHGNNAVKLRKQSFNFAVIVNQHATGRATHKQFHTRHTCVVGTQQLVKVVVRCTQEEGIVSSRHLCGMRHFLLPRLNRRCSGLGVGHIEKRGDTTGHGGATFTVDITFFGHTRIAKVHMFVNHPGEDNFSTTINHIEIFGGNVGKVDTAHVNLCDKSAINHDTTYKAKAIAYNHAIGENFRFHLMPWFLRVTPRKGA